MTRRGATPLGCRHSPAVAGRTYEGRGRDARRPWVASPRPSPFRWGEGAFGVESGRWQAMAAPKPLPAAATLPAIAGRADEGRPLPTRGVVPPRRPDHSPSPSPSKARGTCCAVTQGGWLDTGFFGGWLAKIVSCLRRVGLITLRDRGAGVCFCGGRYLLLVAVCAAPGAGVYRAPDGGGEPTGCDGEP